MADEDPSVSALLMDRGVPLGNSLDIFNRRALHTKIGNLITEPIPVFNVEDAPGSTEVVQVVFGEQLSVAIAATVTITQYTVPAAKTFYLKSFLFSGTNIAQYDFYVDASQLGRHRTWYGEGMNGEFEISSDPKLGLKCTEGQVISISVTQVKPYVADFDASIVGVLVG